MAGANEDGQHARGMGFPHLVKWVEMSVRAHVERAMRGQPISSSQLFAMVLLDEHGEATAAELARLMHLTPQSLTTLLKPLRDQELIEREPDKEHRKRLTMRVTDKGQTMIEQARAFTPAIEESMLGALTEEERAQLTHLLTKIAGMTG